MILCAALIAVLLAASAAPATAVCEPDCSGNGPGDKVEDPRDCTRYYVCIDANTSSQEPLVCPLEKPVFDPVLAECVEGIQCTASCDPPRCKIRCDAVLDTIANPWDCSVYYFCDAAYNPGQPQYCPAERPYFDGKACVSDSSVCCEVPCSPYCGPGDVQAPDPEDCTKYYICLEEGVPDEANHRTCGPGETFQPSSSLCVPGGLCHYLCRTTTTTTTTLTTTNVTTSTPAVTSECMDFLFCPYSGSFAMCTTCQPGYFLCQFEGSYGIPMLCPDGYVFNTDPSYPYCIPAEECPFTPTTTTTTTTTTEPTTTDPCIAYLTCPSPGYFPMCKTCEAGYFECLGEGINGIPLVCPHDYVFNTDPDWPYCVPREDCPYHPPVTP